jgi:hypothetical protein
MKSPKNDRLQKDLQPVSIHCLNELNQAIIGKYLDKKESHLIYTTQDELDHLFTVFSNQEKEKWQVYRDAFGRYYRWKQDNVELVAVWTQFTKQNFKEFLLENHQSVHQHYSLASYSWNCLTKHPATWHAFRSNFVSIRNTNLFNLFQKHYGGTLGPWLQTFQTGDYPNIIKIDINSCYNYHLGYSPLPTGEYKEIKNKEEIKKLLEEDKQGFLYFQLISGNNYYRGKHYPWFPIQRNGKKLWPEKIPAGTYVIHTCLFSYLQADYVLNIRYLKFFVFEHKNGILKDFSDYYYAKKVGHRKGSWQNIIGKAVPNLIIGKFGQHQYHYLHQWEKGKLVNKKKEKRGGSNFDHLMVAIHSLALRQILEEVRKYRKEDILAVRTDCLLLKTVPSKTNIGSQIGQWKLKEIKEAHFYDANRLELDGEILAHGFRIIERREKSVLVERQYYKEDGQLETKQYWKEL